jgi:hypothetical protein
MNTNQVGAVSMGAGFLILILSGFWLSRTGKPYGTLIFAVHKLIAVAAVVLLGITVYRAHRAGVLSTIELFAAIVAGLFFLGTIVTGSLLSIPIEKPMPAFVHRLHQVTPYLTVLSTAVTLYLLSRR